MEIAGKVFIVTGGPSGLGEGTARMLAANGGKVVIADLQADKGEALAKELGGAAVAQFVKCDVSQEADGQAAVAKAVSFGKLVGLVNCAGIAPAAKTVGKEGEYAELLGIVGDNNTWNRSKGFHSVVDRYPGLKMVAQQSAEFDRSKALEVLEAILQAKPDINAVFCGNDAMAMGAYQALLAAGKAGKVKVFGFDGCLLAFHNQDGGKRTACEVSQPKKGLRTLKACHAPSWITIGLDPRGYWAEALLSVPRFQAANVT